MTRERCGERERERCDEKDVTRERCDEREM